MKPNSFAKIVYVLALIAFIIGFAAFSQTPRETNTFRKEQPTKDRDSSTLVKRFRNDDGGNLDQLDIQMKKLDLQMNQLDDQLKKLDFTNIQKQLDIAMKKVDAQKISAEVNQSIKKIDWDRINKEIDESVAKVNKADMMEVKKEMQKVKAELEKQKLNMHFTVPDIDMEKIKADTENSIKNARKSMEKAKEELNNLKEFTNALQSDGLIDKSKPYKIEVKERELYINGNKQPKNVSEKYQRFYRKDNFTIDMTDEKGSEI